MSPSSCNTSEREVERLAIAAQTTLLKARLDETWPSLRMEAAEQGWIGDYFGGFRGWDGPPLSSSPSMSTTTPSFLPAFRSSITVIEEDATDSNPGSLPPSTPSPLTFYSTALLLTLSILFSVNQPPTYYVHQMGAHSASILAVAESLGIGVDTDVGYKCLRMILPLQVVGTLSPIKTQRSRARSVVREWARGSGERGGVCGMVGLCEVALLALGEEGQEGVLAEDDGVEGDDREPVGVNGGDMEVVLSRGLSQSDWWEKKDREGRAFGYLACTQQDVEARLGLGTIG